MWRKMIYTILFLHLLTTADSQQSSSIDNVDKINSGFHATAMANIEIASDVWIHTVAFNLPQANVRDSLNQRLSSSQYDSIVRMMINITVSQGNYLNHLIHDVQQMVPEVKTESNRTARGLCNACGWLVGQVTGLATSSDLERAMESVRSVGKVNAEALREFQKTSAQLASYEEASTGRFKALQQIVEAQRVSYVEMYNRFQENALKFNQTHAALTATLSHLVDFIEEVNDLNILRSALFNVQHGELTPDLIPVQRVTNTINKIRQHLRHNHIPLRLIRTSPNQVYSSKDFFAWRVNTTVYISIKFPLSPLPTALILYRTAKIPLIVHNQNHSTILTQIPNYFAWGRDSDYYMQWDQKPELTASRIYYVDSTTEPLRHRDTDTCLTAIMGDKLAMINSLCQSALQPFTTKPAVFILGPSRLLLINVRSYVIFCQNGTNVRYEGAEAKVITISCGCTFDSAWGHYLAKQINCGNQRTDSTETTDSGHLLNLPLLAAFFEPSQIAQFTGNRLLNAPIQVKLPSLDVYDSQYKNNIAVIDRQSLVLDKIAQQAKNESVIYEGLADKLYNEIQRSDLTFAASGLSVWSYQYWMYTLTTVVVVFLCIGFVFLYNKLRIVIAALTLLNNVPSAMAQQASESITPMILDFFRSKTEVPTVNISQYMPTINSSLEPLDIITIIIVLGFWLFLGIKTYRAQHVSHTFTVYLQIGSQDKDVYIKLLQLQHSPDFYDFNATQFVQTVSVAGIWKPTLTLQWPTFHINHQVTKLKYRLNERYPLSYWQAMKCQTILNNGYYILMWNKSANGTISLVKLNGTSWTRFHSNRVQLQSRLPLQLTAMSFSQPNLYPPLYSDSNEAAATEQGGQEFV
jgi:hypothetical protein